MFLTGSLAGLAAAGPDPEKERDPPAEATPVLFPTYADYHGREWSAETIPDFSTLFARVQKPGDISDALVEAMNITMLPTCSIKEMLPPPVDEWLSDPCSINDDIANSNPVAHRRRKEFTERLAELQVDNDMGYRTVTRTVAEGVRPPRLAHMRKFWQGLESMSQYWDSSLDRYYETAEGPVEEGKSPKRQRLDSEPESENELHRPRAPPVENAPTTSMDSSAEITDDPAIHNAADISVQASENGVDETHQTLDQSGPSTGTTRMRYKGRRTAAGKDMPDTFRSETVRAFIDGSVWPFGATLMAPRVMPIVQFDRLNLPVRQTAAVYMNPHDRVRSRQGILEGPVLGLQVRPELDFGTGSEDLIRSKARLDLMRELGGIIQIAQERRRKLPEVKPGEGKWWTTVPRWGGGPGGEVENVTGNSDIVTPVEEASEEAKDNNGRRGRLGGPRGKGVRKTPAVHWKELKCGKGYWDPRIEYDAVGRSDNSDYDEVYMVSSINHHVSLVKMTVHVAYVDYLRSGTAPNPLPQDPAWCKPTLQRSQWFDLFNVDERVELFRGLWALMAHMIRFLPQAKIER